MNGWRCLKVRIPWFTGEKNENVKLFFSRLEKYLRWQQVPENEMLSASGLYLDKMALDFYDELTERTNNLSYHQMKQIFITRFSKDEISPIIRWKLNHRVLQPNE